MSEQMTEAQLAAHVVAWLEDRGAEIWQEVELIGGVADIIAKVDDEFWIVETKMKFSVELVAQAIARRRRLYAHRVIMAIPRAVANHHRRANDARAICEELGFGLIVVRNGYSYGKHIVPADVTQDVESKHHEVEKGALRKVLRDEHKTHAKAGSADGGRWTKFRGTCEKLAAYVKEHPGVLLTTAIRNIEHHYSSFGSARSALRPLIEKGVVDGVHLVYKGQLGGGAALYPAPP